jgi:hypothetical protein
VIYRAIVRYDNALTEDDILTGRYTTDFGKTYSNPFAPLHTVEPLR